MSNYYIFDYKRYYFMFLLSCSIKCAGIFKNNIVMVFSNKLETVSHCNIVSRGFKKLVFWKLVVYKSGLTFRPRISIRYNSGQVIWTFRAIIQITIWYQKAGLTGEHLNRNNWVESREQGVGDYILNKK